MNNPWQRLTSRELYDNPWIRLQEDHVINPSGGRGIYGVVRFKNKAVGAVPVDTDGHTWLVGQYRYALDVYSWEIPTGGCPAGESPLMGARRELREETGLSAECWSEIARIHTSNSVTDEEGIIYLAQTLTPGEPCFEETEDLSIRRLPFDHALKMVLDGEITDSLSIAGLLKLALVRERFGI